MRRMEKVGQNNSLKKKSRPRGRDFLLMLRDIVCVVKIGKHCTNSKETEDNYNKDKQGIKSIDNFRTHSHTTPFISRKA